MKKSTILAILPLVAFVGAGLYDATGYSRCETSYDTSFNGLYLIKERKCWGLLGLYAGAHEIDRKPLFEEF